MIFNIYKKKNIPHYFLTPFYKKNEKSILHLTTKSSFKRCFVTSVSLVDKSTEKFITKASLADFLDSAKLAKKFSNKVLKKQNFCKVNEVKQPKLLYGKKFFNTDYDLLVFLLNKFLTRPKLSFIEQFDEVKINYSDKAINDSRFNLKGENQLTAIDSKKKDYMLFVKKGIHLSRKSYKLSKSRSSHPSMSKFMLGSRDSVKILNTDISLILMIRALYVMSLVSINKSGVLLINTHPDFFKLIKNRVPFMGLASSANSKWVGGTLTNWKQISKSIISFAKFSHQYGRFLEENNITYPRYNKMKTSFQGFIEKNELLISETRQNNSLMTKSSLFQTSPNKTNFLPTIKNKPALVFLINPNDNKNVIKEANKLDIPIVALTNSDTNLSGITYPIPINGCSLEALHFFFDLVNRVTKKKKAF